MPAAFGLEQRSYRENEISDLFSGAHQLEIASSLMRKIGLEPTPHKLEGVQSLHVGPLSLVPMNFGYGSPLMYRIADGGWSEAVREHDSVLENYCEELKKKGISAKLHDDRLDIALPQNKFYQAERLGEDRLVGISLPLRNENRHRMLDVAFLSLPEELDDRILMRNFLTDAFPGSQTTHHHDDSIEWRGNLGGNNLSFTLHQDEGEPKKIFWDSSKVRKKLDNISLSDIAEELSSQMSSFQTNRILSTFRQGTDVVVRMQDSQIRFSADWDAIRHGFLGEAKLESVPISFLENNSVISLSQKIAGFEHRKSITFPTEDDGIREYIIYVFPRENNSVSIDVTSGTSSLMAFQLNLEPDSQTISGINQLFNINAWYTDPKSDKTYYLEYRQREDNPFLAEIIKVSTHKQKEHGLGSYILSSDEISALNLKAHGYPPTINWVATLSRLLKEKEMDWENAESKLLIPG